MSTKINGVVGPAKDHHDAAEDVAQSSTGSRPVLSVTETIEGLASGSLRFVCGGHHIPTRINRRQREKYDIACRAGYLMAPKSDYPLRSLWARRCDLLELPDVVVVERRDYCTVVWDIIQTRRRFGDTTLAAMRRWLRPYGSRRQVYELNGEVRGLSLGDAQVVAGYVLGTFEACSKPRPLCGGAA